MGAEFTSTTTPEESTTELPDDYVSLMDSHSYDYLSHGNHQCDIYSDSREAAIEEAKVYCSSHSDCGGFAVSQVWESFCPQFFSLNPTTYDNSACTFFVKNEKDPVVTSVYKKTDCRFDYSSTVRSAGDYGAHLSTPKTLEECEALCDAHPECASFVVDQMGGGKCHLRTECPLVNEDCIEASSWGFINYVKEDCDSSAPSYAPSLA